MFLTELLIYDITNSNIRTYMFFLELKGVLMENLLENYPEILDVAMVAKLLHVTSKTIRKHIEKNDIPAIKVGKLYRIPKNWLENYFDENEKRGK